eukprot:CAMPEP_0195526436 /NCGR_PEP_ID=MMETSP0794_2-20130614/27490_1 /TAXON_ID=515487 /ORGANISM="Stephanopyxis turris, Strain CCMP 815" /LENGTH=442 /DNA_ID=CAMNT_0040657121 /DNA_START=380 /DNA_END=1708 /DNA_ORIENTATION=-
MERIPIPEGGEIEVEYVDPINLPKGAALSSIPVVIILHGVNGSSREPYVEQAALQVAVQKGWRAVVLNYSKIRVINNDDGKAARVLGGSNFVDGGDLSFLVSYIRKTHHDFLGAIGFSMGGAKLLQYVGRTREHCNIDAACAISSPLDYGERNVTVCNPVSLEHRVYHLMIASSLKLWILRNYNELVKHPMLRTSAPFRRTTSGLLWWLKSHQVTDIDLAVTIKAKGYSSLDQYYDDASGLERLRNDVKIPFLAIQSMNDPFIPHEIRPGQDIAKDNENIFIVNTKDVGGHVGFWLPGKGCWATKGCLSFFESVIKNMHIQPKSPKLMRQSSIAAAHYMQRTSSTQLTDYNKFIPRDSCSGNDDPATFAVKDFFQKQEKSVSSNASYSITSATTCSSSIFELGECYNEGSKLLKSRSSPARVSRVSSFCSTSSDFSGIMPLD